MKIKDMTQREMILKIVNNPSTSQCIRIMNEWISTHSQEVEKIIKNPLTENK